MDNVVLTLSESAQDHFRRLIEQQGIDGLGVRMQAVQPGTPKADCRLEFCERSDLTGSEWTLECNGFTLYVDAASLAYLDSAEIDYQANVTGGQLTVTMVVSCDAGVPTATSTAVSSTAVSPWGGDGE